MNNTTDTTNWTPKQHAAFAALKAAVAAPRQVTFGKAPKGGWTDADKVAK